MSEMYTLLLAGSPAATQVRGEGRRDQGQPYLAVKQPRAQRA